MDLPYKAIFFDLSGVLYDGDQLIEGAVETVSTARQLGLTVRFVTNTATRSTDTILEKLSRFKIAATPVELFTAPLAAKNYAAKKELRPYLLVHPSIQPMFDDLEQEDPNCVILGDARDALRYETLNKAFQLCHAGASLIAIGYNKYFCNEGELWLDSGAFVHAIEWAASMEAVVMGKPSHLFFEEVVASTPHQARDCLMLGDDLAGDVVGAIEAGLQACLVRTGKFQTSDESELPASATVIDSVADLFASD